MQRSRVKKIEASSEECFVTIDSPFSSNPNEERDERCAKMIGRYEKLAPLSIYVSTVSFKLESR